MIDNSMLPNIEDVLIDIDKAKEKEFKVWELLELSGEVGEVAKTIGYGFSSVMELYREVENGQLAFVNERLGIETLDSCIFSIDLYNKLLKIKDEVIFAEL